MTHSARRQALAGPVVPWLVFVALGGAAFALSCHLMTSKPALATGHALSTAGQILSAARSAISEQFQLMTDIYYHAGTAGRVDDRQWPDTWFRSVRQKLIPRRHTHLSGNQTAEMVPMLWMAIKADPHNIENYLLASYWLSTSAGLNQPELAHSILQEGRRQNPHDARLPLEQALVNLRQGHTVEAGQALDRSLALWPGRDDPESETARQTRHYALTYRALLHESDGAIDDAIACWTELLPLHDRPGDIQTRIALLQRGETPPVQSSRVWQRMLRADDKNRAACDHEHDHSHDHNPHNDP